MNTKEITKNLKTLSDYIYDVASGKKKFTVSEVDLAKFQDEALEVIRNSSDEEVIRETDRVASLNILDKDVNFEFFGQIPKIWSVYQNATEISVKEIQ